jgi:hypothetical protein
MKEKGRKKEIAYFLLKLEISAPKYIYIYIYIHTHAHDYETPQILPASSRQMNIYQHIRNTLLYAM